MKFYGSHKQRSRNLCDKLRYDNATERHQRRKERKKQEKEQGIDLKQVPRTIESSRLYDETIVESDDEEIVGDELIDEFQQYLSGSKVIIRKLLKKRKFVECQANADNKAQAIQKTLSLLVRSYSYLPKFLLLPKN